MIETGAALGERIDVIRNAGGPGFDGPGFRFIEALLRRACALDGDARERLLDRAAARAAAFEHRLRAARADASALRAVLAESIGEAEPRMEALFDDGDFRQYLREGRRTLERAIADDGAVVHRRLERLRTRATQTGVVLPETLIRDLGAYDDVDKRVDSTAVRTLCDRVARAMFDDAASAARATVAIARASDDVPPESGHYNSRALAAEALSLLDALSPVLLRVYVDGLEDLASVRRLPAPVQRSRRKR